MTTLRTAAQQALEALEYHVEQTRPIWKTSEAIAALEAALAEPVQEPVAYLWRHSETGRTRVVMLKERVTTDDAYAWDVVGPLYLTPPQRKPLTEGEISNIWDGHVVPVFGKNGINPIVFARAIERAHGIV